MKNLMKKSKKGFTLMEMLIVVAIIAILVVIAIPTFTNALEEARVNTDLANARAYYAEMVVAAMLNDGNLVDTITEPVFESTSSDLAVEGDTLEYFKVIFTNGSVTEVFGN